MSDIDSESLSSDSVESDSESIIRSKPINIPINIPKKIDENIDFHNTLEIANEILNSKKPKKPIGRGRGRPKKNLSTIGKSEDGLKEFLTQKIEEEEMNWNEKHDILSKDRAIEYLDKLLEIGAITQQTKKEILKLFV